MASVRLFEDTSTASVADTNNSINNNNNNNNKSKTLDDSVEQEEDRILIPGRPDYARCDNKTISAKYTAINFLPKAVMEQFRRFANLYFLIVGFIMFLGEYTPYFKSAVSPWTTLGPLSVVVAFSLAVEGVSDLKRHKNDELTNNAVCVVLRRAPTDNDDDPGRINSSAHGETIDASTSSANDGSKKTGKKDLTVGIRDTSVLGGRDVRVNLNKAYYAKNKSVRGNSISTSDHSTGPTSTPPLPPNRKMASPSSPSTATNTNNGNDDSNNNDDDGRAFVNIAFWKVRRMDIRQGHIVLVKNREMVPADLVLLASSNDQGGAYIETSSIDGETNLKLRNSPQVPKHILKQLRRVEMEAESDANGTFGSAMSSSMHELPADSADRVVEGANTMERNFESIMAATKRIARFSYLGRPNGTSALEHPLYNSSATAGQEDEGDDQQEPDSNDNLQSPNNRRPSDTTHAPPSSGFLRRMTRGANDGHDSSFDDGRYVAALTTEPPNASVHTFSGKITLPPFASDGACFDIPLDADNMLLRGAVLRNTEWAIGIACFTGDDTKLIKNSFQAPSKFSQLDKLMNLTVMVILCVMLLCVTYLSSMAVSTNRDEFDDLYYIGYNRDPNEKWPYLPDTFEAPKWTTSTNNWIQYFFLYITLLNNLVPLSLYVTVEFITVCSLWFINADLDMYDDTTDTRALARSTIVTDLGRIQYIFSDKTGTLTQNVMRFKRCSVDGMVFGSPIQRSRPQGSGDDEDEDEPTPFHPLRQLLVGRFTNSRIPGLERYGDAASGDVITPAQQQRDDKLTFNAEMFIRVMALCHTVVVEKDIDSKDNIDSSMSVTSSKSGRSVSSMARNMFQRKRADTAGSGLGSPLSAVAEDLEHNESDIGSVDRSAGHDPLRGRTASHGSFAPGQNPALAMNKDGSPYGFAYQAESPDEGAFVSAASTTFGFQVVGRDSSGIKLRVHFPSHLREQRVQDGLRSGQLAIRRLAAESAVDTDDDIGLRSHLTPVLETRREEYSAEETWTILAVNKFDSDRKRMSILLRSPPELGGLPILFCKGADTAMLDPGTCANHQMVQQPGEDMMTTTMTSTPLKPNSTTSNLSSVTEGNAYDTEDESNNHADEDGWEIAQMLGLQSHLGDFAKEGLRTLVLGMRVLSEKQCEEWLVQYKAAATSMKDRAALLTQAALAIERDLHVVGATAIEDRLQKEVPDTIATLEKAGIKLWVLTGDKRETAVEIGYSTNVITPKMHLTEVADQGPEHVRTQMAMEFTRLIKKGELPQYQKASLDQERAKTFKQMMQDFQFEMGKFWRGVKRSLLLCVSGVLEVFGASETSASIHKNVNDLEEKEKGIVEAVERRRRVRTRADAVIQEWLNSVAGRARRKSNLRREDDDVSLTSEDTPRVFNRASSARQLLNSMKKSGRLSQSELRQVSLANLTAQQTSDEQPLVDEDTLSLESFFPGSGDDLRNDFDAAKRTVLERLFAIDREVRKGRLRKHLNKNTLISLKEGAKSEMAGGGAGNSNPDGPRALVIEGAALKHLLGDPELEEILFAVASHCEAVIACRVSPRQKAELVNLVRVNVEPEPITLAIGDGANDVGMIQEAHVGIGISGKEGQQAVNASDFAIAQFRFLEELVLIHGRWNFFRLSTVVLFSFYKNAVMAGCLIIFAQRTVYSGTPLFDEWVIAMLNFVAGVPIIMLGLFDRLLSKEYVKKNPEVYKATRQNELITLRSLGRWISLVVVHVLTLYFCTVPQQASGGGNTSAWEGLMRNEPTDSPGEGEGGDLKSVGAVTFTCMIFLLAYKVLFETKSLVHGVWPSFTCDANRGEGVSSRLAYTWIGVTYFSIGFYIAAISFYQIIGRWNAGSFGGFVDVPNHIFGKRSLSWILILFVPMVGMVFDVCGKTFSNMFYPTQTQVHLEIESRGKMLSRSRMHFMRQNWTAPTTSATATAASASPPV